MKMTVITSSVACSFKRLHSSKRLTRLLLTFTVTLFITFWTYFLYRHTKITTDAINTSNYSPIAFSQQQNQQYSFGSSLVKDSILSDNASKYKKIVQKNHNRQDIESMLLQNRYYQWQDNTIALNKPVVDVTVLMHAAQGDSIMDIRKQIKSILSQSVQPKYIYITYKNEAIKKSLEKIINSKYNTIKVNFFYSEMTVEYSNNLHVRDASWLMQQYTISTEFVWIIESNTIPDRQYLNYSHAILQTEEYQSTLLGFEASILQGDKHQLKCLQSRTIERTQQVDMIHGNWLLRTSWIHLLKQELINNAVVVFDQPMAYFISSSLLYRADIPSIAIPSNLKSISPSFCSSSSKIKDFQMSAFNSVLPNVQVQQEILQKKDIKRLVLLFDDSSSTIELLPLMCRFLKQKRNDQLHIVLTNGLTKSTFQDTMISAGCSREESNSFFIHDLTMAYNNGVNQALDMIPADYVTPTIRLLEFLQAQVLIQVKSENNLFYSLAIEATAKVQSITAIQLPLGQVEHALWISDLSIEALQHWNEIKLELVVITDRRPQSLERLLKSTNEAHYLGDDQIELVIHMEQSADSVTRNLVQSFQWNYGNKKMRHRIRKGGLMPAIIESWYPNGDHNYGVLLEDDIELSPFFYSWSKYNILKYRYSPNQEDAYQHIYGISLYSPRNLELLPEGRRQFNPEPVLEKGGFSKRAPYASQIPCSWGAVYFPEHWREFHAYLTERLTKEEWKGYYNITVPKSRSERWKKSWKKYFIELVYLRAYVMVYPNFEEFQSFSTNHLEFGTHVKEKGRTQSKVEQFLVPLMQRDTILDQLPNQQLPFFEHLPIMDLWGNIRSMEDLHQTGSLWHQKVSSCERVTGTYDPADLLCPFEENIEKYKNSTLKGK